MSNSDEMKKAIQSVIIEMMDKVMNRVLESDPFIPEKHHASKPLYSALVPDEIFKGSHFERRFVTPFGKVWEKLALVVAKKSLGYAQTGYKIEGKIKEERLKRISKVLNKLEYPKKGKERKKPNWDEEISYILKGKGEDIPVQVVCDLFTKNYQNGEKYAVELKAPLPNSDQTKVSKEKLLKLYVMQPKQINFAFFALPYNPYGKKENYSWSFPERWFNMKNDQVVLIGDEFWDKIGGVGTYQTFISAVNEIGEDYKIRIYEDFLGVEVPKNNNNFFNL